MKIIKNLLSIGVSSLTNIILGLIAAPIITRIVDPIEYGKFSMFTTHTGVIVSFMYFGLNDALYRFFYSYEKEEEQAGLLKLCFCVPVCISTAISLILIVLYAFEVFKFDYTLLVFILLFINVFSLFWNKISSEMLQNTKKINIYSISIVTQKVIYYVLVILAILIIKNNYLLIMILVTILSNIVSALIGTFATKKYWRLKSINFPDNTKEILKYSFPAYLYFVTYSLYDVFDKYIINYFYGDYEVGIYTSVFSIIGLFAIVQTAFDGIWRPMQTEQYTKNPNDKELIQKGNLYATIIMYFIGLNVILFKNILILFIGSEYRSGVDIIPFLIFNPIMNVLIGTVTSGIEYAKKSYLRLITIVTTLIIELLLSIILMPYFGYKGVAIALAISLIFQYLLTMHFSNKYYYIDYSCKEFMFITVVMFIYAYISYIQNNIVINIFIYILNLVLLWVLYKKDIKNIINICYRSLFNLKINNK